MKTPSIKQVIHYSSPEAASIQTVTGWVSSSGQFWGNDEHMARWSGCTHVACKTCGVAIEKNGWTICGECRQKKDDADFDALERKPWDGNAPLYSESYDAYFYDVDGVLERLADEGCSVDDLRLRICTPNYASEIEGDQWVDDLPEDGDLPTELEAAMDALNAVIKKLPPLSWSPGKYAADPESVRAIFEAAQSAGKGVE